MSALADLLCQAGLDKVNKELQRKQELLFEFFELNRKESFSIYDVLAWIGVIGTKHLEMVESFWQEGIESGEDVSEICLDLIRYQQDLSNFLYEKIQRQHVKTRKS